MKKLKGKIRKRETSKEPYVAFSKVSNLNKCFSRITLAYFFKHFKLLRTQIIIMNRNYSHVFLF